MNIHKSNNTSISDNHQPIYENSKSVIDNVTPQYNNGDAKPSAAVRHDSTDANHRDECLHTYRTEIPNLIDDMGLTVYEYRLYGHYKRVTGDNGQCWESTRTSAKICTMSISQVSKAKRGLTRKGWIIVESRPNNQTDLITIVNVWAQNLQAYQAMSAAKSPAADFDALPAGSVRPSSPVGGQTSKDEGIRHRGGVFATKTGCSYSEQGVRHSALKKEPFKKEPFKKEPKSKSKQAAALPLPSAISEKELFPETETETETAALAQAEISPGAPLLEELRRHGFELSGAEAEQRANRYFERYGLAACLEAVDYTVGQHQALLQRGKAGIGSPLHYMEKRLSDPPKRAVAHQDAPRNYQAGAPELPPVTPPPSAPALESSYSDVVEPEPEAPRPTDDALPANDQPKEHGDQQADLDRRIDKKWPITLAPKRDEVRMALRGGVPYADLLHLIDNTENFRDLIAAIPTLRAQVSAGATQFAAAR